jgi:hypothetical protein
MSENIGRPSRIFETERVEEFLQMIQNGVDFNIAADSSMLARSTVFEWLKKGRQIQRREEEPTSLSKSEHAYLDFLERFMRARVTPEIKAVEVISKSIEKGSWRAAAWVLEHRFPERWSLDRVGRETQILEKPHAAIMDLELEAKVEAILKKEKQLDAQ